MCAVARVAVSSAVKEGETVRCKAVSVCELRDCGGWVISRGAVVRALLCAPHRHGRRQYGDSPRRDRERGRVATGFSSEGDDVKRGVKKQEMGRQRLP
jgi:hypothetical protein